MFHKTVAIGIIAAVAVVVASATLGKGGPPAATPAHDDRQRTAPATGSDEKPAMAAMEHYNFEGKIVYAQFSGSTDFACLKGVSVQRFGGRAFLVGTMALPEQADLPEFDVWFPLDNVKAFCVYRNLADMKKSCDIAAKVSNSSPGKSAAPTLSNGLPATLPPLSNP